MANYIDITSLFPVNPAMDDRNITYISSFVLVRLKNSQSLVKAMAEHDLDLPISAQAQNAIALIQQRTAEEAAKNSNHTYVGIRGVTLVIFVPTETYKDTDNNVVQVSYGSR